MTEREVSARRDAAVRERSIVKNVYLWMTAGLGLTGLVAFGVAGNPALMESLVGNGIGLLLLIIGEFALVFYLSARLDRMSQASAIGAFLAYSVLNGVLFSTLFVVYTGVVIYKAFLTAALMFAGMSIYAMTTKRDLAGWGYYLRMALWGLIIAMLVNFLFRSTVLDLVISVIGVAVFLGLTAYDTRKIMKLNAQYGATMDGEAYTKVSIIGALNLYLDFVNLFLYLLRIFGRGGDR